EFSLGTPCTANRRGNRQGPDLTTHSQHSVKPEWHEAAPSIFFKVLAADIEKNRVSVLVRLAPGTDYPPHRHAGIEEVHLPHGEMMIDDKKFYPGITFVPSPAASIIMSGARRVARVFSSRQPKTQYFDFWSRINSSSLSATKSYVGQSSIPGREKCRSV